MLHKQPTLCLQIYKVQPSHLKPHKSFPHCELTFWGSSTRIHFVSALASEAAAYRQLATPLGSGRAPRSGLAEH